jgi:hypothetical protein
VLGLLGDSVVLLDLIPYFTTRPIINEIIKQKKNIPRITCFLHL